MKKLLYLIAGMLMLTGTALADCGTCEGDAEKAKEKAACEMKKGAGAVDKAACDMKGAEKKMKEKKHEHKKMMEEKKHEHTKMMDKSEEKASEQAQEKRKKWWKFWGGEVEPAAE